MAGGEGTRFAPLSTPEKPKQFLNFIGNGSFIQQTRNRALALVPNERIIIATNKRYIPIVQEQLPDIPYDNLIAEPLKKNTAPCIAYASRMILERDPQAAIVVLPSDHVILKSDKFEWVIKHAVQVARKDKKLITIGIRPDRPATEYGYIQSSNTNHNEEGNAVSITSFVEKPDEERAKQYLNEGKYVWNSGMFIWTADALLAEISVHLPAMYQLLNEYSTDEKFLTRFFNKVQPVSIDYGVMEKTDRGVVISCDLGWSDIGTWEGLHRLSLCKDVCISSNVLECMKQALGHTAAGLPRRIEKPWGYEEIWAHTDEYVGKMLYIKESHRLSYQYHKVKVETIRVLQGAIQLESEDSGERRSVRLNEGDIYHIKPKTKHRFIALQNTMLLEVSTPQLNDVVRLEDDYGRG